MPMHKLLMKNENSVNIVLNSLIVLLSSLVLYVYYIHTDNLVVWSQAKVLMLQISINDM